jgi:AraC family transcriptional regulator
MGDWNFSVGEVNQVSVAFASADTKTSELGPTIGRLLGQVCVANKAQGVSMAGPPFCRYTDWRDTDCTVDVGAPISGEFIEADGVKPGMLGGPGLHLCFSFYGAYEKLHGAYGDADVWMAANGYTWAGAPWDSYITDPLVEPDPSKWQTDIFAPIRKIQP